METTYICRKHSNLQIALKSGMARFENGELVTSDKGVQEGIEAHRWYGLKIEKLVPRPAVQKQQEGKNSTTGGGPRHPKIIHPSRVKGPPPKAERDEAYAKAMESLNSQVLDKKKRKVPTRTSVKASNKRALLDIAEEWEIEVPEENSAMAIRNHVNEFFEERWAGVKKRQSTMKKTKHKKKVVQGKEKRDAEAKRKKEKYEAWKNRDNKLIADKTPKNRRGSK